MPRIMPKTCRTTLDRIHDYLFQAYRRGSVDGAIAAVAGMRISRDNPADFVAAAELFLREHGAAN